MKNGDIVEAPADRVDKTLGKKILLLFFESQKYDRKEIWTTVSQNAEITTTF